MWEVADCLRDYRTNENGDFDMGLLCTSDKINIFAKNKPINHTSLSPLTPDQRKGLDTDQAKGIFYGIEIVGSNDITLFKNLAKVHDVQFKYHKPTQRFRLRDFDGYDHNATANPFADSPSQGYYNDEFDGGKGISSIKCSYDKNNIYGIDLTDRLVAVSGTDTLEKGFPAIVITKSNGKTYFTALQYQDNTYRPLKVGNDYATGTWYCKMSKKRKSGADELSSPFLADEVVTASIILIKSATSSMPLLNLGGVNFGTHWIEVDGSQQTSAIPVILAGALGKKITLSELFTGVIFQANSVTALKLVGSNVTFNVNLGEATGKTSTNQIQITIQLTINGGSTYTKVVNLDGFEGTYNRLVLFETDIVHANAQTTYSGTVVVTTKDGNFTNIRTMSFNNI